jgi:predicted nucleic-acid-binding protein
LWVLTGCYASTKNEVCDILETLLRTREIVVAQSDTIWKAIHLFKGGKADFADCLIERSAAEAGCSHMATFDRKAAMDCGMRLIG